MKKRNLFLLLLILMLFSYASVDFLQSKHFAMAEDDDEEEDEERENTQAVQSVQPITVKEPDRIITTTTMREIVIKDSDRDGLPDESDPHPQIAEIYIVNDENKNGVADWLEGGK